MSPTVRNPFRPRRPLRFRYFVTAVMLDDGTSREALLDRLTAAAIVGPHKAGRAGQAVTVMFGVPQPNQSDVSDAANAWRSALSALEDAAADLDALVRLDVEPLGPSGGGVAD